ncbi:MAG: hypothetical protein K0R26_648 [Bacteroidota bacterium]|jgi:DNA-binding beta-propeller fold protein YncE|nr:hypothetical protein [Bacteroidota bacterium]
MGKLHYGKFLVQVSVIMIMCAIFNSCTKDSAPPLYGNYPSEIGEIIVNKCATAGCHNDQSFEAADGLNLSTYLKMFQGSKNGSPVIPYRSDFSSLCFYINSYNELGPINTPRMPLNGPALSREEVQKIKIWIDNGAPDIDGKIMWSDNPNRKKYYVLNQGCDVVTVIDAESKLPIRYITVGSNPNMVESPHMIKVSPDGKYWYVIFLANNILQKYSTADDRFISQVILGPVQNWNTMVISNNSQKAYCVSWQSNSRLAVVNLDNMTLANNIGGGNFSDAHGIALNTSNDTIYITRQTGNYIYKIDTALNTIAEITLDGSSIPNQTSSLDPHEIIFSKDGSRYFVTCQKTNEVRVVATAGDVLVQSISTGKYPSEMAINNNYLYVTCQDEPSPNSNIRGCISQINLFTYQNQNFEVGYQPHGLVLDEAKDVLVVASRNISTAGPIPHHLGVCGRNGFVNYFQASTMMLLKQKTEVASDPYSIAIRP